MIKSFKSFFIFIAFLFLIIESKAQTTDKIIPLVVYKLDSLWYFLNSNGKQIFPPQQLEGFAGSRMAFSE